MSIWNTGPIGRACMQVGLSSVMLAACSGVHAGIDPFRVSVSQSVTYDNNYLRRDKALQSELVSSSTLTFGLDKAYGRQRYTLSASGTTQRNRNFKEFSNDGYGFSATVNSTIGANSYGALAVQSARSQQNPDEQTGLRRAQSVSTRTASAFLLHGLYSRLGGTANLSTTRTEYSVQTDQDKDQIGGRLGVRFSPSDRLSFDLGYKQSDIELVNITSAARTINRSDIDLTTTWFVSGYTNLRGSLALSKERRPGTEGFDFDGVTGSLSWDFTPGGRTSYAVTFSRDTSNAGQGTLFSIPTDSTTVTSFTNPTQNLLTNTLSASLRYALSSKVNLSGGVSHSQYSNALTGSNTSTNQLSDIRGFEKATVDTTGVSAGFSFAPHRLVSVGCNVLAYKRGKSRLTNGEGYKGESLGCSANLSLD
jgi:hypothetical protein